MKIRIIAYLIFFFSTSLFAQTEVEIYGDNTYPPYSFKESGRMTGIYTIVLERVFSLMPDYKVKFKGLPWKRGLSEVKKGSIFALYPPYERRKERPYMDYDMPILNEELVVFCAKDILSKSRPNWPEDYFNLSVGNNAGFAAGGDAFWSAVKAKKISVQEAKGTPQNLLKLIAGRIDCYMNDALSIKWELKKLENEGKYDGVSLIQGATISSEQGFLGFTTNDTQFPYKKDFKKQYINILKKMKANGEIQKIINDFIK